LRTHDNPLNRSRGARSIVSAAVKTVFRTVGAVLPIAAVFGLIWVSLQAVAPTPHGKPGSGIVLRTDVTAIWVPKALRDQAQSEAGRPIIRSPDELRNYLERHGLIDAWYALVSRGYQVNGDSAEITQVRRVSEAPAHIEELQDVMATAAGNPPRSEIRDFSRATVGIIPDALLTADPRKAVTELMVPQDVRK
jgi:hypothetical protein